MGTPTSHACWLPGREAGLLPQAGPSYLPVDLAFLQPGDAVPLQRALLIKLSERPGGWGRAGQGGGEGGAGLRASSLLLRASPQAPWAVCQSASCLSALFRVQPQPHPARPILAPVSEKAGFICLDDDHIEELAPVGAHHVPHPLVPVYRWPCSRWEGARVAPTAVPGCPPLDSHKAEGTVGDEEQLLPMGHQAAEDSKGLIPS